MAQEFRNLKKSSYFKNDFERLNEFGFLIKVVCKEAITVHKKM